MERMMSDWFSGSWTASFLFCTNWAQSLYLVTVFPSWVHQFFIHPFYFYFTEVLTSFLQHIAICIYLCFAGEVVFRFLAFGFISHTTRISKKTSFLCKRLVVKKINLETVFPALQNWSVLHWTFKARGFKSECPLTPSGRWHMIKNQFPW